MKKKYLVTDGSRAYTAPNLSYAIDLAHGFSGNAFIITSSAYGFRRVCPQCGDETEVFRVRPTYLEGCQVCS